MQCAQFLGIAAVAVLVLTGDALAHGAQYRVVGVSETQVEFAYTDGEPMSFASFELFGPADPRVPVRSGRTDRQGRVGFVPDAAGAWRIEVRDSEGHAVRAVLTSAGGQVATQQSMPDWLGAISLSLNAVGIAWLLQRLLDRRRRPLERRADRVA